MVGILCENVLLGMLNYKHFDTLRQMSTIENTQILVKYILNYYN